MCSGKLSHRIFHDNNGRNRTLGDGQGYRVAPVTFVVCQVKQSMTKHFDISLNLWISDNQLPHANLLKISGISES